MNREQNTFFSDLLQNLGFIAAAVVALSQYALNESFKFLFENNTELMKMSSLVALILSGAIFFGFFAIRFNLLTKVYPNKKKKGEYFASLREESKVEQPKSPLGDKEKKIKTGKKISEPFNFTLIQLAFLFILLSLISFMASIFSVNPYLVSLFYILFICFIVASISIFSIQLYRDKETKRKREETNELIMNKIRQYFIGDIQILYDSTNLFTLTGPNRHIIFEYKGTKYDVFTKSYDPESYFLLSVHKN